MSDEIPRRIRMDKWTPAEKAIDDAVRAVEAMPADERLTNAVVLLGEARAWVADFVDGVPVSEHYPRPAPLPDYEEARERFHATATHEEPTWENTSLGDVLRADGYVPTDEPEPPR